MDGLTGSDWLVLMYLLWPRCAAEPQTFWRIHVATYKGTISHSAALRLLYKVERCNFYFVKFDVCSFTLLPVKVMSCLRRDLAMDSVNGPQPSVSSQLIGRLKQLGKWYSSTRAPLYTEIQRSFTDNAFHICYKDDSGKRIFWDHLPLLACDIDYSLGVWCILGWGGFQSL